MFTAFSRLVSLSAASLRKFFAFCRTLNERSKNVTSNPRKHVKYLLAVTSILTALVAARPSVAQGTLLWQQNLSGTLNSFAGATSVAVDNLGNVVAAGSTVNTGTSSDFTVAKFDPHGTLLWVQYLN